MHSPQLRPILSLSHAFKRGIQGGANPIAVVDPAFPIGGVWTHWGGGFGPPTQAFFGKNVCENERIGSCRGACARHAPLDPPMLWEVSMS